MFSLFMLGLSVAGAVGIFAYGEVLKGVDRAKSAELVVAEADIDSSQVEAFIRSRDRFTSSADILDRHIELSNFFEVLESLTLVNVRFDSFGFTYLPDGTGEITLSGSARSFNALAAQSSAFSAQKEIKRAIFSGIQVAENGTVSFTVEATLDDDLLVFKEDAVAVPVAPAPAAPIESAAPATTSAPSGTLVPPSSATTSPVTPTSL